MKKILTLAVMLAGATTALAATRITTRAELAAITNNLAGAYELGCDIDLAGEPWTPIGNNFHKFTGSLDGCGHVISNLTVTAGSSNYVGLFGYLGSSGTDARVANLRIANATVSGRSYVGTLAGCAEDATVTNCSVVGATVMATGGPNYGRAGGLIGHIKINCFVSRCFAIADVSAGSHHVGGFIGVIDDDNHAPCVVSNCFSVGSVSSTANCVGGFIGYVTGGHGSGSFVFDCYTVARAHGSDSVGGFFGKLEQNCKVTLARCYTAGGDGDTTGNSHVGGFAGTLSGGATCDNCFRLVDGLADVGSEESGGGYNGTIVALDAAEMRSTNNFTAFQAAGCWTQTDGQTQPYFDWGLVDGKFLLLAGDTATATVNGLGAYAPGTDVPISINHPADRIFLGWTGGATYANASANETTVLLDNYHVVSVTLGTRITTRAQLEAISSNLSGLYGLDADIDLSGSPWTPIGSLGSPFTGKLYGYGHKITGLTFDNTSSGDSAGARVGLFRSIDGATIDGVHLEGVSIKGYERCGALAGEVHGTSTIRNCSAQGSVSGNYSYIGLLAGFISGPGVLFEGCATTGTVSAAGSDAGGFAGIARGGSVTFTDCHACADVTSVGANDSRGGFISAIFDIGSFTFTRCTAEGTVSVCKDEHDYQNSNLGGFIGYVDRRCRGTFTDCSANVSVSAGYRKAGGFVGYIRDGAAAPSFLRCTAVGDVSVTDAFAGGFVGSSEGNASFTDCRADGHVDGKGDVGGFVGSASAPLMISNCVARGDVRSSGDNYGGFAGTLTNAASVVSDSWCSGPAWGTGNTIGSFVGNAGDTANGTIRNCSISAYGAGPRPFCGSNGSVTGGSLTVHQVEELSKDGNGTPWPEVKQRAQGATKIRTVEELIAVTNNLAGIYVLDGDIDLGGAAWTPFGSFTGEFYGQNHRITNFVVNAADGSAGFFGRIAGGRVSGVVLEGTVTGAADVGVGGFAGAIDSKSLVEGCSFQGAVTNATTCNAGGFVGSVSDSPVILRCCVLHATVAANTSGQSDSYAGGFVASLNGGYVMDCYAIADVNADGSYVGGFAGFVDGLITNAYCVGSVTSSGSYHGAFAGGSGSSAKITKSYYDYNKAGLGAVNNAGYTGVTGRSSGQMCYAANFAFDFDDVWKIDKGETTPYLRTFLVQVPEPELTGFQRFLVKYGLDVNTEPLYVTNGIPLIARYVYGIEPLNAQTDVNGHPLIDFKMNANGTPVFELAPQKNPDEYGLVFTILASPTLSPWITIDEYPFDPATDLCIPDLGTPAPPTMFFRWRLVLTGK